MTTELIRQRSDILNTQVITRNNGKRLGVVKELLVDIDRREVVALGLRDNLLSIAGLPRYMLLSSVQQIGDVILVEDEDVVEDVDVDAYSSLINSEVITETGELLGRVRGFKFNVEDGTVASLIIASIGLPQIPDQVLSTYELPIEEIVSSGPDRLIVFEGAQERLVQLTVGLLERLGVGRPPWEREEEEGYYIPAARPENQLGTGIPIRTPVAQPIQTATPVEETWDDDWQEPEPEPLRRQIAEPMYAEAQLEEDNWGDEWTDTSQSPRRYQEPVYVEPEPYDKDYREEYVDYEVEGDAWEDKVEPEPYKAPRVNIPEKTKTPEYEEEAGY
ncbi:MULTISPECIES: PRC-barrel domain-containing protein [unclassified Coleofasciculus]|uniref:PRC-barrel domain-containing protein n=1 Tax=unclassified Coleofasciculus TaxID=2692782 RepID=UPI0018816761|nr:MULTISPECIES: PRC-barrel domain-containing protein [unclassified Coleofasciculus]MBE9129091.1 PRC-barrel domain-containing protein [Coleofasciculus sp. LEGE 07081]MBE9151764.1 PRC-barrel domain-containing protein [Coleofasciculus sp. LEGE 07092]